MVGIRHRDDSGLWHKYPTTGLGRVLGVIAMFCGIALIGVLTSFLANFFLAPAKKKAAERALAPTNPKSKIAQLTAMLDEQTQANAALRETLKEMEQML